MSPILPPPYTLLVIGGLYVHVPFCTRRCPYCDFVLIESKGTPPSRFLDAVLQEARAAHERTPSFQARTLYFGGGTPSLLPPEMLEELVCELSTTFSLAPDAEITIEVNPEHLTPVLAVTYRGLGFNRLSLGVQSFHEPELQLLGRQHSPERARQCVAWARNAGIDNLSIDLIFGLPGQSRADWEHNLKETITLAPDHVSLYGLTFEPGTPLTRDVTAGALRPLSEEDGAAQYRLSIELLESAGYLSYEISNFARPGFESRHNLIYWNREPYLGFGPGAHSFLPEIRSWNTSNVRQYLEQDDPRWRSESLTEDQRRMEEILLGLRQSRGVSSDHPFLQNSVAQELMEQGFLERSGTQVRLTPRGRCVCDTIIERLTSVERRPQ